MNFKNKLMQSKAVLLRENNEEKTMTHFLKALRSIGYFKTIDEACVLMDKYLSEQPVELELNEYKYEIIRLLEEFEFNYTVKSY